MAVKVTNWARRRGNGRIELDIAKMSSQSAIPKEIRSQKKKHDGEDIVKRRHPEWEENQITWRMLQDSYEGGMRYRNGIYGTDRKGMPVRMLFRHRREYPDPGEFPTAYQGFSGFMGVGLARQQNIGFGAWPGMTGADPAATAMDDDYEYRRSRTPVVEFVKEAVDIHIGKIYDQEVSRRGPAELEDWWKDVDGLGTSMDEWMETICSPQLAVLGCLDLCFDRPHLPPGVVIENRAQQKQYDLDRCIVSIILPQNMVWWRLFNGRYIECLVLEYVDPSDRQDTDEDGNAIDPHDKSSDVASEWRRSYMHMRHWTTTESTLYSYDGTEILEGPIPHDYGRPPIVRVFDTPKHRTSHIGKSRYEFIAACQREYYNRSSELILSDTLQATPLLSGPSDYCKPDQTISVGPGNVLPKLDTGEGRYEGWEFVSPSKDPAESIRKNMADIMDLKDRAACLTKPSGFGNAPATALSQTGISKQIDAVNGNKLLSALAGAFAKAERVMAEYALLCLRNEIPSREDRNEIEVNYSSRFELFGAAELSLMLNQFQANLQGMVESGCVMTQTIWIKEEIRQGLIGLTDDQYRAIDQEVEQYAERVMALQAAIRESMAPAAITSKSEALQGEGTALSAASQDTSGVSGSTRVTPLGYRVP